MSALESRGAGVSLEPEIQLFLSWLEQEAGVDAGVAGKLWDEVTWHRLVMNGSKAFFVDDVFFSVCNVGHIVKMHRMLRAGDVFGLRQRMTVLFSRPNFYDDAFDINEATCDKLPVTSGKPED